MSKQSVSATIDTDLIKKLNQVANETERNRSWLISKAIGFYLDELEDLKIAKGRLDEERLSPIEMRKSLGI